MSDKRHNPDNMDEVFSEKDSLKTDASAAFADNAPEQSAHLQKTPHEHALDEYSDDVLVSDIRREDASLMPHNADPNEVYDKEVYDKDVYDKEVYDKEVYDDIYDLTEEERHAISMQHKASSNEYDASDISAHYPDTTVPSQYDDADMYAHAQERVILEKADHDESDEGPQEVCVPPSMAEKVFRGMDTVSVLCILFLFLLHLSASIWFSSGYLQSEELVVQTFQNMVKAGQWIIPTSFEVTIMPGYYCFMALIALIPMPVGLFLPVLTAISALVAVMGTYTLAWCLMPKGKREGVPFVTGLLLLSSPAFMAFGHTVVPEVLTAGLLAFALAFLYRGWVSSSGFFCFMSAFLFASLAVFVGGAVPLWMLVCGSVLFTLWRTTFRRAHRLDAVIGFGCFVLVFAVWLVVIILLGGEGADSLDAVLLYFITPFMPPYWPLDMARLQGLCFLALLLLPWAFIPLFVNWFKLIGQSVSRLKASRKENAGTAWAWISLVVGCLILLRQGDVTLQAVIPLLPLVAFLLAKALCHLSARASRFFFLFVVFLLLAVGAVLALVSVPATASLWMHSVPALVKDIFLAAHGLPFVAAVFLVASVVLLLCTRREFARGTLLALAFFACVLVQPITVLVVPSLVNMSFDSYAGGRMLSSHPLGAGMEVFPYGMRTQGMQTKP